MQHAYALDALYLKNMYLFLERCRKSNNVWLHALIQSDCLYSSLFFEHYNRILLCDWVLEGTGGYRGSNWGDRSPKTYENKFIYHNFVQFWKKLSRQYETWLSTILEVAPLTSWAGSAPAWTLVFVWGHVCHNTFVL